MKKHLATLLFVSLMMSLLAICALAQGVQSVELHGFMQNRFYANPDSSARFVAERVSLSAVGKFGTDAIGYVEVYYHPWLTDRVIGVPQPTPPVTGYTAEQSRIYLESAYADLPAGEGDCESEKAGSLTSGLLLPIRIERQANTESYRRRSLRTALSERSILKKSARLTSVEVCIPINACKIEKSVISPAHRSIS